MSPTDRREDSDHRRRRCDRKTPREGMQDQHTGAQLRFLRAQPVDLPALCGREPGVPRDPGPVGLLHRHPQPCPGTPRGSDLDARRAGRRARARRRPPPVGVSALIASSATAFTIVKYAGAAYLVLLGVRKLVSQGEQDLEPERRGPASGHRLFWQGMIVNILNPKTALFFLAFLPQFVDPSAGPIAPQMLVLGTLLVRHRRAQRRHLRARRRGRRAAAARDSRRTAHARPPERRRVHLARARGGAGRRAAPEVALRSFAAPGGVAERSNAPVLKTGVRSRGPRVRIPPPPLGTVEIWLYQGAFRPLVSGQCAESRGQRGPPFVPLYREGSFPGLSPEGTVGERLGAMHLQGSRVTGLRCSRPRWERRLRARRRRRWAG